MDVESISCIFCWYKLANEILCSKPVVPKVGYTALRGGAKKQWGGKGALEMGPSKRVVAYLRLKWL
jgi:hypothetical protein